MPQLGEPFEWGNAWEGTEYGAIIDELIGKTGENRERIEKLESIVEGLRYDFEAFKNDTIKTVVNIVSSTRIQHSTEVTLIVRAT
jgi:hypothetical protein